MANALAPSVPAPDIPAAPQTNQGNALGGQQPPMPQGGMPPAPSQAQTIAALRHFHAIEKTLTGLLKNPETGKADVKGEVIDAVTGLVSGGFLKASEAVQTLGTFPERPFEQKKWLEKHFMDAVSAADAVLAHHGAAFQGQNLQGAAPSMDGHTEMMAGLMKQYRGGNA